MTHLTTLVANWRVVVAVASLVAFAVSGTATDPTPW
jgi:hypothetical protein